MTADSIVLLLINKVDSVWSEEKQEDVKLVLLWDGSSLSETRILRKLRQKSLCQVSRFLILIKKQKKKKLTRCKIDSEEFMVKMQLEMLFGVRMMPNQQTRREISSCCQFRRNLQLSVISRPKLRSIIYSSLCSLQIWSIQTPLEDSICLHSMDQLCFIIRLTHASVLTVPHSPKTNWKLQFIKNRRPLVRNQVWVTPPWSLENQSVWEELKKLSNRLEN